ncbi:MAG: HD domain-containing protein [Candidatus Altiarchaeota archaeon]|nr:HD domain-containing protein [Candidatus Altiarchaeota archaeon]
MVFVKDAIHGFVEISREEQMIVDSKWFQRLHRIRQNGWDFLVYPSAVHTRFSHSLGVTHIAGKLAESFAIEPARVRMAGLVHDIGHGPFMHQSEEVIKARLGKTNRQIGAEIVSTEMGSLFERAGFEPSELIEIFSGQSDSIEARIISGSSHKGLSLDADKFDYLLRDNYFTGARAGDFDLPYLMKNMKPSGGVISVDSKAIEEIDQAISMKLNLEAKVYYHKTCRIADCMWIRALDDWVLDGGDLEALWKLGDEAALSVVNNSIVHRLLVRDLNKLAVVGKLKGAEHMASGKIKVKGLDLDEIEKINQLSLDVQKEIEQELEKQTGFQGIVLVKTPKLEFNPRELGTSIYVSDKNSMIKYEELRSLEDMATKNAEMWFFGISGPSGSRPKLANLKLSDIISVL